MRKLSAREWLAFFAIYVIWFDLPGNPARGRTIPPLLTAGVRHLVAGAVLYGVFAWMGGRVRVGAREWRARVVVAVLFFLIGHGTLHWAEQTVPSGIAALLMATEPVWIAMLMPADRQRLGWRTIAGLIAGLAGVALLIPRDASSAVRVA